MFIKLFKEFICSNNANLNFSELELGPARPQPFFFLNFSFFSYSLPRMRGCFMKAIDFHFRYLYFDPLTSLCDLFILQDG